MKDAQYPHPYNDVCAHQKIMTESSAYMRVCCWGSALSIYKTYAHGCASVKSPLWRCYVTCECGGAVGMRERQERERGLSILSRSCTTFLCDARDQQHESKELSACIMYIKNVGAASIHLFLLMSAPCESAHWFFFFLLWQRPRNRVWIGDKMRPATHLLTIGGWRSAIDFPSQAASVN